VRILQLAKKMPFPPKDGESVAILQLTQGLAKAGHSLTLLTMNTPKHHFNLANLPTQTKNSITIDAATVDTSLSVVAAFVNLFGQSSYNIDRFDNDNYRQLLTTYLQNNTYDLIQLEGVYLATYINTIKQYSKAVVVMRAHNLEFEIWERLADEQQNPLKRYYLKLLAKRMKRFELNAINQYDAIVPISTKDEAFFTSVGCSKPIFTLSGGVDVADYVADDANVVEFPSVFFIGALDWLPNQEGLKWFINQVWLNVLTHLPNVKLYVAGRRCPANFATQLQQTANVVFVGEVDNALDFIHPKAVMVVPLFSGSGMRIKIIEGMAAAKTIVATTIAAEGINYTHTKNIWIADNADTFQQHLIYCLQNANVCQQTGIAAQQLIAQQHSNKQLIAQLVEFYQQLINNK
jgi:glycosyltransferase involved in cell wall biosynthesis